MITFTFRIDEEDPSGRGPVVVVFVIEKENMVRMTHADPFDLKLKQMGVNSPQAARTLAGRKATDVDIVIAYEDPEGIKAIGDLFARKDMPGIMTFLERGRTLYEGEPRDPERL